MIPRSRRQASSTDPDGAQPLATLVALPPWMRDALCSEPDYVDLPFFPERGQTPAPAKAVCVGCLVRQDCLDYAVTLDLPGIWGGTSEGERVALRRGNQRGATDRAPVPRARPAGTADRSPR